MDNNLNNNNNNINFDPMTGQPINNVNFDPMTGLPVNNGNIQQPTGIVNQQEPVVQNTPVQQMNGVVQESVVPKKNNTIFIVIAVLVVVAIVVGILLLGGKKDKANVNNTEINNNQTNNNESNNTENNIETNVGNSSDLVEKEYTGDKQNLYVATVGHVDHGKTTLTSALTKLYGKYVSSDVISSSPEVKKEGVVYNASFLEYESTSNHYSHYDMPSNADIIKSLLSGSVRLDGAILVVSALDGVMPQTREHLRVLKNVGVGKIVVYMSKCDMIDDQDLLDLVEMEIRDLINEYGFDGDNTPVVRGSALKALKGDKNEEENIRKLVNMMDKWLIKNNDNSGKAVASTKLGVEVYVLTKEEGGRHTPFFAGYRPVVSNFSEKESASITLPEGVEMVMPGDYIDMTVTLDKAMAFKKGDYFKLMEGGIITAVGVVNSIIE